MRRELLFVEGESELGLDGAANVDNCVSEPTLVDDFHAHPNIHVSEDPLLALFVLPRMV